MNALSLFPRLRLRLTRVAAATVFVALGLLSAVGASVTSAADAEADSVVPPALTIPHLVITPLHTAAVPSPLAGVIQSIAVTTGSDVVAGEMLAQLDVAEAQSVAAQAEAEAEVADQLATATSAVDLAKQELALAVQMQEKQSLLVAQASARAANQLPLQAAEKAASVAENELQRATTARNRFADSVSQSEIDGLTLDHQRAELEAQQADLQRSLDQFTAQIEQQTAAELETNRQTAELRLAQARFDQSVLQLRAAASRAQADRAGLLVQRHRITTPLDGVVAETLRQPGEWVQPGDTIFRVVGLNQLRAEGFLTAQQATQLRRWRSDGLTLRIRLQVDTPLPGSDGQTLSSEHASQSGDVLQVEGQLGFLSPEVDAINHQVRFWVTLDNGSQQVLPGMKAAVTITVEPAS